MFLNSPVRFDGGEPLEPDATGRKAEALQLWRKVWDAFGEGLSYPGGDPVLTRCAQRSVAGVRTPPRGYQPGLAQYWVLSTYS